MFSAELPYMDAIRRSRNRNEGLPKGGRSRLCRLPSASHGFLHLLKSPAGCPCFLSYSDSQTSVAALHSAFGAALAVGCWPWWKSQEDALHGRNTPVKESQR